MKSAKRKAAQNREAWLTVATLVCIWTVLLVAFFAVKRHSYFGDEGYHLEQIRLFLARKWEITSAMTTIPGYHLLLAGIASFTQTDDLNVYRLVSLCVSGLSILFFWLCARSIGSKQPLTRTVQFTFIPFLFPYFPLVYTDIPSLLFVLVALYATLHRAYACAAIAAFLGVGVRQNNIIWCAFFLILFLDREYRNNVLHWLKRKWNIAMGIKTYASPTQIKPLWSGVVIALYLLGFGLFGAFIYWNGGLAIGDKSAHPFPSFHIGNIVFMLVLLAVMWLPLHIGNLRAIWALLRKHGLTVLAVFLGCLSLYLLLYHNDHGYNQGADSVFMRNRILVRSVSTEMHRVLFFLPCFFAGLSIAATKLRRPVYLWLYALTIFYLLPSWLIEQRYYFIPITLFLLLREERSKWLERISATYGVVTTIALFIPVAERWFFL